MDLIPLRTIGEAFAFHDLSLLPMERIGARLVILVEELGLSEHWAAFLLSFLEGDRMDPLLSKVFVLYQESLLTLDEISLHIFSHISGYYFIFAFLSLFSFFFICILLETLFAPMGQEEEETPLLIRFFSATLNLFLTLFFLLFLRQVLSPLLEYFTIRLDGSLLLEHAEPILRYFKLWYRQIIL